MKYRNQNLSVLGYGCMRYTKKGSTIDYEKAAHEMMLAYQGGVNYFDTAYVYKGCEAVLGRFLNENGIRETVNIATKLPHYFVKSTSDFDKFFEEQLRRLQTDYIDYYLMHMLSDLNSWNRLVSLGIDDWIKQKKESGKIRNIGFSFHGGTDMFIKILDAYAWDFCQIQFNYMDEHAQAGIEGLKYAHKKGLPVIIMEPLRGGRLVNNLSSGVKKIWAEAPMKRSAAEWAFRWIWNHEEATVVLSGMNDEAQVKENLASADEALPGMLSSKELALFDRVRGEMNRVVKVGCTGCSYCMPCPRGVDIPNCFHAYNVKYVDGTYNALREYLMLTTLKKIRSNASLCIKCGKCETHCPQHIAIRDELAMVKKKLETPIYHIAKFFAGLGRF